MAVPVRNGGRHIERALRSILDQDVESLEVVVVDNASDDATEAICRRVAGEDARVRYVRNPTDIGAAANFCRAFELTRGRYFKWAAHDDWLEPGYLRACLTVLERDEGTVLAFPGTTICSEAGDALRRFRYPDGFVSEQRAERFDHSLWSFTCAAAVFGLARTDAVRRTRLIQPYTSADRVFLSELALQGRFAQLEPFLFNSTESDARRGRTPTWWTTAPPRRPTCDRWHLLRDYLGLATRTPGLSPVERTRMVLSVLAFFCRRWPRRALVREAKQWIGHGVRSVTGRYRPRALEASRSRP